MWAISLRVQFAHKPRAIYIESLSFPGISLCKKHSIRNSHLEIIDTIKWEYFIMLLFLSLPLPPCARFCCFVLLNCKRDKIHTKRLPLSCSLLSKNIYVITILRSLQLSVGCFTQFSTRIASFAPVFLGTVAFLYNS